MQDGERKLLQYEHVLSRLEALAMMMYFSQWETKQGLPVPDHNFQIIDIMQVETKCVKGEDIKRTGTGEVSSNVQKSPGKSTCLQGDLH